MNSHLGVDWASGSWLVVKTGQETIVTTEPSILNVWHEHGRGEDVRSIFVDIPIGLPESGPRVCDREAGEWLEDRGRSVFSIPGRDVVYTDDYCAARKSNGGSLGSQSWWLFPRIRAVDVFLQEFEQARGKIYESHPEVCFAKLADDSLPPKDTDAGREGRLAVLKEDQKLHDRVSEVIHTREDGADWHDRISTGRLDDVLDAAVLALTAKKLDLDSQSETGSYPAFPEQDDPGTDEILDIHPEILYPEA